MLLLVKYVVLRNVWDCMGRKSVWVVILYEILYTGYKKNKAAEWTVGGI